MAVYAASLLLLACRSPLATAFPGGAPESACDTLSPDPNAHGAPPTLCSDEDCPFQMEVVDRDNFYFCGEESVTLRSKSVIIIIIMKSYIYMYI